MAPFSEGRLRFLEEAAASSVEVPDRDSELRSETTGMKHTSFTRTAIDHEQTVIHEQVQQPALLSPCAQPISS